MNSELIAENASEQTSEKLYKSKTLRPPKLWRATVMAISMFCGISIIVVWNWYILDMRSKKENQYLFEINTGDIAQRLHARILSYEMVLRGLASNFANSAGNISLAQWNKIIDQMRVQELYASINTLVWSRYISSAQLEDFIYNQQIAGREKFKVFPPGVRDSYQIIEYIAPFNDGTRNILGMDLFTQIPQNNAINQAMNSGEAILTAPLDLSLGDREKHKIGALLYLPTYTTVIAPKTLAERRANFLGATSVAFRGNDLVTGIFADQLKLFHIVVFDAENLDTPVFDSWSDNAPELPKNWQARFHAKRTLNIYGRTWLLEVVGTPAYERSIIFSDRSHSTTLIMGLGVAFLVALLTCGFFYQRDKQMYAKEQVAVKLRKQANQLMLANQYKSEFLANMSHELRTPLNSILILSDQLRQNTVGNLNEKQIRHADIVHRAGSDLLQLINDVLDLAKIEAGRMQISLEPVDLQDLLVDLDSSMRPLAEAKNLHLSIPSIATKDEVPQKVYTDRVRLHQILRNLLSNAIKFTDEGLVRLLVTVEKTLDAKNKIIKFAVIDSGIGIDSSKHKQVFQAFQQLDGSTRRRFGGTGLGLAITKQLVEALNGEITLQSEQGKGSNFSVLIPMQVVPESINNLPTIKRIGSGVGVLLVEDDADFAEIIIEQAINHNFSVTHCSTGNQALEVLAQESFKIIILDILLPDISGWRLFRQIRSQEKYQNTPINIISCLPNNGNLRADQGTHYLTKPVSYEALEQIFVELDETINSAHSLNLLLVEDVEVEREHYRERLQKLGFKVSIAENAKSALAMWTDNKFDVLVIDLNLPDQDGFSLLSNLEQIRSLAGVRVVINTGLDLSCANLQLLQNYSAIVVNKQGIDTSKLSEAVQGFLATVKVDEDSNHIQTNVNLAKSDADYAQVGLTGRRLLLVDDDIRNVYAMSALLDEFGCEVIAAGNGKEAIATYQNTELDLILMDMSMPVMDGYTATNLLKTKYDCTIPIIALTAHAMKGDREKCLAAGADDYMAKPVNKNELKSLLERWLKLKLDS